MIYEHLKVNHSIQFVNDAGDNTNKIEGHWRHAKRFLPKFGARMSHFSSYLAEFMWRHQNKTEDLFFKIISDISEAFPVQNENRNDTYEHA